MSNETCFPRNLPGIQLLVSDPDSAPGEAQHSDLALLALDLIEFNFEIKVHRTATTAELIVPDAERKVSVLFLVVLFW